MLLLADKGLGESFPPSDLRGLEDQCREWALTELSPRFSVIADALDIVAAAWEPLEAFWTESRDRLNEVLAAHIPLVLSEPDEEAAISLARSMREDLALVIAQSPPM